MGENNKETKTSDSNNIEAVNKPVDNNKPSWNKVKKFLKGLSHKIEKLINGIKDEFVGRLNDTDNKNQKSFSEVNDRIERDTKKLDDKIRCVKEDLTEIIKTMVSEIDRLNDYIKSLGDSEKGLASTVLEETKKYINETKEEIDKVQKIITERIDASDNQTNEIRDAVYKISDACEKLEAGLNTSLNNQPSISTKVIEELKPRIENISEAIDLMQRKLEKQYHEITNSETGVSAVVIKELQNYSENNKKEILSKIDDLTKAQQNTNSKVDETLNILQRELVQYKDALQKAKENIQGLNNALRKTQEANAQLEASLNEEKMKNKQNEEEKISLEREYAYLNNKYSIFDTFMSDYKKIFKLVQSCKSLQSLLGDANNPESTEDLLKFLLIFGSDQSFASRVYSAMREYKKQSVCPVDAEEIKLIEFLNRFYRDRHQLNFDVFELPESIDGQIKFDKNKMQDMDRPSDNLMRSVAAVYVPALRRDASVISFKAIIKGVK